MFVWLASYPKSGNTFVRSLLAAYFFSKDGIYNFDLINNIKQFPNLTLFENLGINIKDDNEVIKNYIRVQETFCKKNSIQFLKTHSYLFNIGNKYPFTDLNNSLGAIYIVRDPRNVLNSFTKFYDFSADRAASAMINEISFGGDLGVKKKQVESARVWTGTWNKHYQSWKSFNYQNRYLLIKYEDLTQETEKVFVKILEFVHKLNKSTFLLNKNKLNNVLKSTSFSNMQNLEKTKGFAESRLDNKGKKIPFFNLGPKNDWKKSLDSKIKEKIEKAFEKEMAELGYL